MAATPIQCDLYLRLSDGRHENGSFIQREEALRAKAAQLGWGVHRVVIENDLISNGSKSASAFKRRKVGTDANGRPIMRVWRPGFRSILDDLATGRVQAILAEDLDRTMRDPRDAEDLIDVIRERRAFADSLSCSLKFTAGGTDSEQLQARVLVAVAQKASQDTARRVAAGRQRKAARGEFGGGRRPYGFDNYTSQRPEEVAEIRRAADQLLAGVSLKAVARDMRQRGVPTVTGAKWSAETLRDVLLRPINAGIVVYQGQETDVRLPGDPILAEDVWRAIVAKLTDPARSQPGRAPVWLGTNIYRCICGSRMEIQAGKGRAAAYRCAREQGQGDVHVRRNAAQLDSFVTDLVCARLARQDASKLFATSRRNVDLKALRAQAEGLKELRSEIMRDRDEGLITRSEMAERLRRNKAKLEAVEAQLAAETDRSPLDDIVGAEDVRGTWERLSLGQRREILRMLVEVKVLPVTRRGRGFDDDAVAVQWC